MPAQNMITNNVLTRVFCLKAGDDLASGFTIEVGAVQYLITAGHVVKSLESGKKLQVLQNGDWVEIEFRRIPVEPDIVDIGVLALKRDLSNKFDVDLKGIKDCILSEPVFFVGFPFGLSIPVGSLNRGYPIALVKHGIVAALPVRRGEPFLVDAINNPGFSGGPVVRVDNPKKPTIVGVVSGYRATQEAVYQGQAKTSLTTQANTGLLVAFGLDYALEAIEKNNQAAKAK
jgi:hypothetical protein